MRRVLFSTRARRVFPLKQAVLARGHGIKKVKNETSRMEKDGVSRPDVNRPRGPKRRNIVLRSQTLSEQDAGTCPFPNITLPHGVRPKMRGQPSPNLVAGLGPGWFESRSMGETHSGGMGEDGGFWVGTWGNFAGVAGVSRPTSRAIGFSALNPAALP